MRAFIPPSPPFHHHLTLYFPFTSTCRSLPFRRLLLGAPPRHVPFITPLALSSPPSTRLNRETVRTIEQLPLTRRSLALLHLVARSPSRLPHAFPTSTPTLAHLNRPQPSARPPSSRLLRHHNPFARVLLSFIAVATDHFQPRLFAHVCHQSSPPPSSN